MVLSFPKPCYETWLHLLVAAGFRQLMFAAAAAGGGLCCLFASAAASAFTKILVAQEESEEEELSRAPTSKSKKTQKAEIRDSDEHN
jgi:hypothetical protein